ncbi:DUF6660 family protein [Catalinimonas niigatensis]|uniref:DUF6660 family protein n=1 Tax=Catalinimonas niigatensis TaxID=1397264 RepID=UPI00389902E6
MPCADEIEVDCTDTNNAHEQLCLTHNDFSPQEEAPGEFCTPFCHCHCCHSHVTFMEMDWHSQPVSPFSQKNTPYRQQKEYLFPFSIFQPPRV